MTISTPEELLSHGVVEHLEPRPQAHADDAGQHSDQQRRRDGGNMNGRHEDAEEPRPAGKHQASRGPKPRLLSSASFVASFVPPDFVWDGVLQRGFLYSMTAPTGTGKTAIGLLIGAKIALGQSLGGRETQRGSVVVLSGENSDDVRMRWMMMAERMGFNVQTIPVNFVEGTFSLDTFSADVIQQIDQLPECALVIVDTSAAFFEGSEENANVEAGNHARKLRRFTMCSSRPCVVVLCHPTKNASADNLIPRGGGAFLAEVDGNLSLRSITDTTVEMHWQGKLRGPGFEPVNFDLTKATSDRLVDSRGRKMMTVVATDLNHAEAEARQQAALSKEDKMLVAMSELDDPSYAEIAQHLGWISRTGEPQKSVVAYSMKRLEDVGLVEKGRGGTYRLTKQGRKEVERIADTAVQTVERSSSYRSNWTDL